MKQSSEDNSHGLTPPPAPDEDSGAPDEAFEQATLTLPIDAPPAPEPTDAALPPAPPVSLDASPAPHASPSPVSQPGSALAFTPMSRASRRRMKRSMIVIAILAAVGGVSALSIMFANWTRTPEATVRQYLDHLAAGNADAATAMADPGLPYEQRGFLTNAVMASANSRIVVEDVVAAPYGGNKVTTVTATMQLDGDRFTYSFGVTAAKPTFGLLNNWKMQNALVARVNITGTKVSYFTVGGAKGAINVEALSGGSDYVFYPGVYTFTPADIGDYIDAAPVTTRVKADMTATNRGVASTSVSLTGSYNDALASAALDAAIALTNSCASAPGNTNKACPLMVQSTDLSVLEVKSLPTSLQPNPFWDRTYTGRATFRIKGSGRNSKVEDIERTITVNVKAEDSGTLILDSSGKPQFKVTFDW
ncbi:hypothetical protein [uncultured Actinomyces sp.]|jgi:hypothetical protein|uniref:hypothetical protein n=1 Tax=uncultured Actinomyces sp. TaxID=249061 RepID=UPI002619B4FC|nr:hypothetical protein [uncultured Actinomyces sp.]